MFIIKYKKIFIAISAVLVALAIVAILAFGLRLGIDFKGGSQLDVVYDAELPESQAVRSALSEVGIENALIQPLGTNEYIIKTRPLTQEEREKTLRVLDDKYSGSVSEKSFTTIGPSVGNELVRKSIIAIILVVIGIILYITYSFRHVSKPVASWKYGTIAIITLLHDVIIPTGIFAVLGYINGMELDTLFIVAVLTILGLSVSDTIVVFDRVRENLRAKKYETFSETVGQSLNQTFTRSINTSLTTLLVLLSLAFFGPESTRMFSAMLAAGMFFGTYSSLFLASPLLVAWEKLSPQKAE